ncbi:PRC-barrel domain-containing protein [Siccirubricoccus sp. KC 17139]|uniref:PRC-barrel domain-containing protein n=1 Tax=Siccirubricoccus soli TaxID=2899147 RepID=A0ABT1DCW4_9PROT|nr:PRC-barrel domain-containing protein [Siccirubricoccus soli]MCO6419773.1 PRC-barrel domain-containing protein [Siccirubricoccus soli]MCP2685908.1 PRC-barrel domain-containing protein [Siccirubricoccus soli]
MPDTSVVAAGPVPIEESATLIAAEKVSGTPVFDLEGNSLGHVETVMLDKRAGRVAYAVLAFGGFLGFGEKLYPLPWSVLTYDVALGGYRVGLDKAKLESGPSFTAAEAPDWGDRAWGERLHTHYGQRPYWEGLLI